MAVHGSDESKPLACPECGKRFLSNSALACHLKVHATEMFSYDCPICSQPFDQIHALKEHVHIHRINNVYTCPHCLKVIRNTNLMLLRNLFAYASCLFTNFRNSRNMPWFVNTFERFMLRSASNVPTVKKHLREVINSRLTWSSKWYPHNAEKRELYSSHFDNNSWNFLMKSC